MLLLQKGRNISNPKCAIFGCLLLVFAMVGFQFQMMRANVLRIARPELSEYFQMGTSWWNDNAATSEDSEDVTDDNPLNILILYPDDWRHDSLEDAQPSLIHTPFLSQLAREGIRFTHNAVTSSICWISRATLFTGRYASQHMSLRLTCPVFTDFTWWQHSWPYLLMKQKGYWVGHIGKWQFRNNDVFLRDNAFNWTRLHEGSHWYRRPRGPDKTKVHAATRAQEDAIQFLRERPKDRPFALTVAFYPPKAVGDYTGPGEQWSPDEKVYEMYKDHPFVEPYNFSEAFDSLPEFLKNGISRRRYDYRYSTHHHYVEGMKRYFALVTQVDQASQQIVEELKRQNLYNNTMIIFTTDNGLMLGAHGLAGKWHPYEESIRVPMIIRDPRIPVEKRGVPDDSFTLNIDLAPTILGAAGIKPSSLMQGRDISDLYLSKKKKVQEPWRDEFYYEMPLDEFPSSTAVITKKWKYMKWPSNENFEQLFDLENDPYELHDVKNHSENQAILVELREKYAKLMEDAISPNITDKPACNRREYGKVFEILSTF